MECDQRVGNYSLVTLLRTGVSLSVTAGLTFFPAPETTKLDKLVVSFKTIASIIIRFNGKDEL